jgi:hypothetical protein
MLNTKGLDFDLPPDGGIAGAGVAWRLVEGGERVNAKGYWGITPVIVELENPGRRIQDKGVGARDITNFVSRTCTNQEGIA